MEKLKFYLALPMLPSLFDFGFASILYLFLAYILGMGLWQFRQIRLLNENEESVHARSLVPLGWAAVAMGFVALIQRYREAFDLIEAAGDISPSIVASAMSAALSYPTLGLLCLAISFLFKYFNQ